MDDEKEGSTGSGMRPVKCSGSGTQGVPLRLVGREVTVLLQRRCAGTHDVRSAEGVPPPICRYSTHRTYNPQSQRYEQATPPRILGVPSARIGTSSAAAAVERVRSRCTATLISQCFRARAPRYIFGHNRDSLMDIRSDRHSHSARRLLEQFTFAITFRQTAQDKARASLGTNALHLHRSRVFLCLSSTR